MTAQNHVPRALLPEGLRDDLPPWAEHEAQMTDRLMKAVSQYGYERVAPPLVEFEESLLAASGKSQADAMFRVLDPASQKMMAVRSDMTLQVARIATDRLGGQVRPLRLSYAGHVLRVKGTQLRPSRQFRQAGVELIGSDELAGDIEVILLAAESLKGLGIEGLSVDLVSPTLVMALAEQLELTDEEAKNAQHALDAKDAAALLEFPSEARALLGEVMNAAGSAHQVLPRLESLDLKGNAAEKRDRLVSLARSLLSQGGDLVVTIDAGEMRGFEYQTGIGFAFFAQSGHGELGRGGRYLVERSDGTKESAVGFSMYLDSLLRAAPKPLPIPRLYLPFGTEPSECRRLRDIGWRTVQGLCPTDDNFESARTQGCSHVYDKGVATSLTDDEPIEQE